MVPLAETRVHTRGVQKSEIGPRAFPWFSVVLLALIHLSLAWALDTANWADGLEITSFAVLAGIVVGSLLAASPWPPGFIRFYTLITGLAFTLYLGSTLVPDTVQGLDRPIEVLNRLSTWFIDAVAGEPTGDNLVFVVDVAFLMWWMSVGTTVGLVRERKVWAAVIPTGVVLTINAYYAAPDLTGFLLLYLGATLLLLVSSHLDEMITLWEAHHVRYPLDVGYLFLRNGLLFSLIILILAWYTPEVVGIRRVERWLEPLKSPWHRVQEEWGRIFSTLNYTPSGVIPAFGTSFTLRGAPNLSDTPYFTVRAEKGRYWRAAVYDYYRGTGWDDTVTRTKDLAADENVRLPLVVGGEILTQTVTVEQPGAISLIAAPMPLQFSVPVEAEVLEYKGQVGSGEEILFAYARYVLEPGATYSVISYVLDPDAPSLRNASTDYPDWVRKYYLQLPADFPDRVRQLARDLTLAYDNPYDKAKAIERYLRSIPYNEDIPAPPRDRDAVEWFLFELQQGYCDYYASAMVVMLRSLGIPARLASGYARGLYDAEAKTWTVRESDAHSWPEVYFPGYGWIPFEPTPSEPPLERREPPPSDANEQERLEQFRDNPDREQNIPEDEEAFGSEGVAVPFLPVMLPVPANVVRAVQAVPWRLVFGLTLLLALFYLGWQFFRQRLLARADLAVTLYARLVRWGRRLGVRLTAAQTPAEHREHLVQVLPAQRQAVTAIVETYQVATYAPTSLRAQVAARRQMLVEMWERLLPYLWWEWLRRLPRQIKRRRKAQ